MSAALTGSGDGSGLNAASLGAAQSGSNGSGRDNRWLTLEVCREFQRSKCSRTEQECKYAHPPAHVEVQNGRVTCCFDSIKGKCNRKDPPCKYLHPPAHLKEQLLQNGRNNLVARNMMMQQMQLLQQLSANPAAAAGNVPVMYQSSSSLTSAQQAVLTPTSSLYPSAYLGAATLNGSPSPTGVASSSSDVSNAFQSALLNVNAQQTAANSAASNQLIAALLGQLAAGNAPSTAAAGLTAQQQQQQQYRALQLALLQAAQQKQVLAATGYSNVAPTASSPTLLSGGSYSGLQGGASLSGLQGGMTLTGLQPGLGTLQNGGLTALQASLNGASQQSANGVNDASANANSANALLQSLSTYGSNGTQQRSSAEQSSDSTSARGAGTANGTGTGTRKRLHADATMSSSAATAATSAASSCAANANASANLTSSSTNAYDLLPLEQNQLILAASGVPAALVAKRVASVDARTGLPCYNPATQPQAVTMYPSNLTSSATANVSFVPSSAASLSSSYQHALLAALSGLATTSTLPTALQQTSTAAFLQQPHSLGYSQSAGLPIAKIMTSGNGSSSTLTAALPPR